MNMINSTAGYLYYPGTSDAPADEYEISADAEKDIATMQRASRIIARTVRLLKALPKVESLISMETPDEVAVILNDYAFAPADIERQIEAEDRTRFYNERED